MQENNDPVKQMAVKLLKKKLWAILLPMLPTIFFIFIIMVLILVVIYPVIKGGQLVEGVSGFWDRIENAITLKCLFCTNDELKSKEEQKFYDKIKEIDKTYLSGKNMEGTSIQLDIPLLLSALLYTTDADVEGTFTEEANTDLMEDAISGDLFGDLSWYYDETDQKSANWHVPEGEEGSCYIESYNYYEKPQFTLGKKSKLRQLAKHMVKQTVEGSCWREYKTDEKTGKSYFDGWRHNEWYVYKLDIEPDDKFYTMEFDQNPFSKTVDKNQVSSLPSSFVIYLVNEYLPQTFEANLPPEVRDLSKEHETYLNKRKVMKNEIYYYKDGYEYFTQGGLEFSGICGELNGSCTYSVKDKFNKKVEVSNLKVKLLQCKDGTRGQPIEGEELVDFEKYITGVTYAEIGDDAPMEALKTEALAARGYALLRGQKMGVTYLGIYQENGQWILPIRNCTEDQVYCDPDKGCTVKNGAKNATDNTVYSGTIEGKQQYKGPLSADSNVRKAVAETNGKVLVDKKGNIVYTNYTDKEQQEWIAGAKAGNDAFQMLVATYKDASSLKSSCSGNVGTSINSGGNRYYNKYDYAHVPYCTGEYTLATSGDLATSFAMAVENTTGTVTTPEMVANYLCSNNYVTLGNTNTAFLLDSNTSSRFKVNIKTISLIDRSINHVLDILKSGKNIIVSLKGDGAFATEEGNYILLSSVTPEGKVKVLDPSRRNTTGDISIDQFQKSILDKVNYGMWEVSGASNSVNSSYNGCYTGATGDYLGWNQKDKAWENVPLGYGHSTVGSAGCAVTSIAKLIAMSGTQITISSFNPGTMTKYLNAHKGFSSGTGNIIWDSPRLTGLAPNFHYVGRKYLTNMTKQEKIIEVKKYLDQGYYLVLQVDDAPSLGKSHFVAVLGVVNDNIVMSDPAQNQWAIKTDKVWERYKLERTTYFLYYKKTD